MVMTKDAFKTLTHKYFSRRNGAIGLIDDRLGLVHKHPGDKQRLKELKDAILAFQDEKNTKFGPKGGDWKMSKREGKGGIATLLAEVDLALGPPPVMGINTSGGLLQNIMQRAQARIQVADAEVRNVSVPVRQTLDYRDGTGPKNFAWTVTLQLNERPTELVVRVALKTSEQAGVSAKYKENWKTHIQGAWNGALLKIPSRGTPLPMRFELDWKPIGYSGPAYLVDVHQPPPQPAQKDYVKQGGSWVKQEKTATVGTDVGTPHMGQWGAQDSAAIIHEFGHMIGCPDEYYTTSFQGAATAADMYDQVPFTTNSIMNNTGPEGRIFPRHYALIRQQYEAWRGLAPDSCSVQVTG